MADTGAPYFIPYVEPTDLVRDYPAADEASADAIAAALDAIPVLAGIGSNVVQTVKTNTFTTSSGTYVDVTGLTATITPTSATSKILIVANVSFAGGLSCYGRLARGATGIYEGDTAGARISAGFAFRLGGRNPMGYLLSFLDSPGVTTATTYAVQVRSGDGDPLVNFGADDGLNDNRAGRTASSITVIEVAA